MKDEKALIEIPKDIIDVIDNTKASQNKVELLHLYKQVFPRHPRVVVEIGTWRGYSLELWYSFFHPDKLITIDNEKDSQDFVLSRVRNKEFLYMDKAPLAIKGNSTDKSVVDTVKQILGKDKIDFLFIDGDHHYEAVKKDFETYIGLMNKNSIVAFHDISLKGNNRDGHSWYDMGVQVSKFWEEIKNEYRCDEVTGPEGTGTGILYV